MNFCQYDHLCLGILYEKNQCEDKAFLIDKQLTKAGQGVSDLYTTVVTLSWLPKWQLRKTKQFIEEEAELHKYMKHVHYTDPNGRDISFNDRGEVPFTWILRNWVIKIDHNTKTTNILDRRIAVIEESSQGDLNFSFSDLLIRWKNGEQPQSLCNDPCPPGSRKTSDGGYQVCCYICVPCSEGEVSNLSDSQICHKCPREEWPDKQSITCIQKPREFLSYEKDNLVTAFSVVAIFCSVLTLFIIRLFIDYWDTPIVKANNRTMSFILLVSILLSFLCVFFFLGRPVDITCLLRQASFGILFSIGVSSVLAKTVTVCIAFKATKPGRSIAKLTSLKISNYVVFICSSIQVLICVAWLSASPPYVEFDHDTYPGMIIIQCNEGSDIWFYSMLGYLGILAAVSFVLAFIVRTLPDSFNEAKYITFSMLVFISVWIVLIPAYLSTRGKYMVAVEIFAILTSSAGILGCIFSPKVYIILLKPELNSKSIILEKNKS
ncbi:vomeronasal type-2 receptor 26-like [Anomaloglossus baeobatrachus]